MESDVTVLLRFFLFSMIPLNFKNNAKYYCLSSNVFGKQKLNYEAIFQMPLIKKKKLKLAKSKLSKLRSINNLWGKNNFGNLKNWAVT